MFLSCCHIGQKELKVLSVSHLSLHIIQLTHEFQSCDELLLSSTWVLANAVSSAVMFRK